MEEQDYIWTESVLTTFEFVFFFLFGVEQWFLFSVCWYSIHYLTLILVNRVSDAYVVRHCPSCQVAPQMEDLGTAVFSVSSAISELKFF